MNKEDAKPGIRLFIFIFSAIMIPIAIFYDFPTAEEIAVAINADAGVEEEVAENAPEKAEEKKISFQEEYGPMKPILRRQMGATNIHAITTNDKNTKRLKSWSVKTPEWFDKIDSYIVCQDGMGCKKYSGFKQFALDLLQPKDLVCDQAMPESECEQLRVKSVVLIFSICAIGHGQVLLFHHGESMADWDDIGSADWNNIDWEKNLRIIHRWMNDVQIADEYFTRIAMKFAKNNGPAVDDIGAAYYSGSEMGTVFAEAYRRGKKFLTKMFGGDVSQYKDKTTYGRGIKKCFKAKAKNINTGKVDKALRWSGRLTKKDSEDKSDGSEILGISNSTKYKHVDILALKECLFQRETGGKNASFKGRKGAARQEKTWLKRGITIDLISPEEVDAKFINAPQPQQPSQPDSGPATESKPEKEEAPKPAPKKKGDVKKKKEICITGTNGKQICI